MYARYDDRYLLSLQRYIQYYIGCVIHHISVVAVLYLEREAISEAVSVLA